MLGLCRQFLQVAEGVALRARLKKGRPSTSIAVASTVVLIDIGPKEDNYFFKIVKDSSLFPDDPDCAEGWLPPRHDRYHVPKYDYENDEEVSIPPSLKEAIISFILGVYASL